MTEETKKIKFIYNSKSGLTSSLIDFFHKNISPKTNKCNLCAVTYNMLGKRKTWIKFLESSNKKIYFYYKDNLNELGLPENTKLPAVYDEKNQLLVNFNQINKCNNLEELIDLLKQSIGRKVKF